MPKINHAVLSAIPEELLYIKEKLKASCKQVKIGEFEFSVCDYKNCKILLASTGLGTTFAASILTFIKIHFNPEAVLFCGVAGEISADINVCDVVIAEEAYEAEIQPAFQLLKDTPFETCLNNPILNKPFPALYPASKELLAEIKDVSFSRDVKVHLGKMVTSNNFPAPKALFDDIKNSNAIAIDMETSALYQVAWLFNIQIIAVRGISNILDHDGGDEKIKKSGLKGSAESAGKIVLNIMDALIQKYNLEYNDIDSEKEINELISQFKLQPHPEGGFYVRNHTSAFEVNSYDPDRYDGKARKAGTSIYYLLRDKDFSAFHILKSDEIWHHYKGSPVTIHTIDQSGNLKSQLLGDPAITPDAKFQIAIPADNWFAAEIADKKYFSFVGCTVSPGFEFQDFSLADRNALTKQFPALADIIKRFTRINEENNTLTEEISHKPF